MKKSKGRSRSSSSFFSKILNRVLITGVLTISCMIFIKRDSSFKDFFYDKVIGVNFDFAYVNSVYHKYFGGVLPFSDLFNSTEPVFNESLVYSDSVNYLDGVSLTVKDDYLVPSIDSGLVIFVGEKEGYGNTVIIQGINGVDVWYGNLNNIDVSLYEYVSKGVIVGGCSNNLYMVFKKDGNVLDYQKYI